MTAVTAYYGCEKPAAFPIPDGEFDVSSDVAEALAGFLEPSDCHLFAIDDIFNTAASDNVVSSRSPTADQCSLDCWAKRQDCCYSGELQQPLCFETEFAELQQLLCFEAEFAPADPPELHYFQPSPLAERSEPPPQPPEHLEQSPCSAKFAEPQQSLCFEPEQSICSETEFTPAEPPELHYFQPTPLAEHPEQPPLPPQHFEQTQFPGEFTFHSPPKSVAGTGLSAQSTAARERRKRISDKTQELSRLIPGGGRMNTAEMLQAAHNYVRFLQAQSGILELDKGKSGGEEEEELFQVLITSTAIQEKLSKQGMCLVPAVIAEEFMQREINKFSELIGEEA